MAPPRRRSGDPRRWHRRSRSPAAAVGSAWRDWPGLCGGSLPGPQGWAMATRWSRCWVRRPMPAFSALIFCGLAARRTYRA